MDFSKWRRRVPVPLMARNYRPGLSGGGSSVHVNQPWQQPISFTFNTASPVFVYALPAGQRVTTVQVIITEPFDVPTQIRVGTVGTPDLFMPASDNDPSQIDEYETNPTVAASGLTTNILMTLSSPGATQGAGIVMVQTVAASGSPFTPADLPDLFWWLRADLGIAEDGFGNITQWNDSSGNGRNLVTTIITTGPTIQNNAINSKPAVNFGANFPQRMEVQAGNIADWAFLSGNGGTNATIFAVIYSNALGTRLFSTRKNDNTEGGIKYGPDVNGGNDFKLQGFDSGGGSVYGTQAANDVNVFKYWTGIIDYNTPEFTLRKNGVQVSTSAVLNPSADNPFQRPFIDRQDFAGTGFVGFIAEIILYNRLLTPAEIGQIEAYIAGRYAL